jgi:hypothetical protein
MIFTFLGRLVAHWHPSVLRNYLHLFKSDKLYNSIITDENLVGTNSSMNHFLRKAIQCGKNRETNEPSLILFKILLFSNIMSQTDTFNHLHYNYGHCLLFFSNNTVDLNDIGMANFLENTWSNNVLVWRFNQRSIPKIHSDSVKFVNFKNLICVLLKVKTAIKFVAATWMQHL